MLGGRLVAALLADSPRKRGEGLREGYRPEGTIVGRRGSRWGCTACGAELTGWFGKCPECAAWNTVEEVAEPTSGDRVVLAPSGTAPVASTEAAATDDAPRCMSGVGEVDRVLGGGLVAGSVVLLGGAPGIGKSTLVLQIGGSLARQAGPVLYASGEESVSQVSARAARLGAAHDRLLLMAETRVEAILDAARSLDETPAAVVVDSIQTVYTDSQDGLPGNLAQVRAVTGQLVSHAKSTGVPVVVVGHVTKDGQLAGPKLLEHLVDAVLAFEGEDERATRLLRATKNRFGSTQELGVFEMTGDGLREIENPSAAFLADRAEQPIGSCVTASVEGSRPLLLEVQALLSPCTVGSPRRTCVGVDASRVAMLLAVLDRHGDMFALDQDVFVNVAGGLRVREPAADLALLLAVASSHTRRALAPGTVAIGEVGLTGELRRVPRMETRLAEAARLGLRRALIPTRTRGRVPDGLEIVEAGDVRGALELAFAP